MVDERQSTGEGTLTKNRRQSRRPIDEVDAVRLSGLPRRAPDDLGIVDRFELEPSFPRFILALATTSTWVVHASVLAGDWQLVLENGLRYAHHVHGELQRPFRVTRRRETR
jgi:hypothetical protein